MRKIMMMAALASCAALALAGCGTSVSSALPPTPTDAAQTVYELKSALVAAEDALLVYEQTICPATGTCTDSRAIAINKALVTADTLVTAAEIAVQADPSSSAALTTAQAAVEVVQALATQYAAKG